MIKRLYKPLRCVYHRFIVSIILYLVHDLCLRPLKHFTAGLNLSSVSFSFPISK